MTSISVPFSSALFLLVLGAAALVRLFRITELPLGPYPDEIFALNTASISATDLSTSLAIPR